MALRRLRKGLARGPVCGRASEEYVRGAKSRRAQLREVFLDFDSGSRFERCLRSFYGPRLKACPPMDAEKIPAFLGQAREFWDEWARWVDEFGDSNQPAAVNKDAVRAVNSYF